MIRATVRERGWRFCTMVFQGRRTGRAERPSNENRHRQKVCTSPHTRTPAHARKLRDRSHIALTERNLATLGFGTLFASDFCLIGRSNGRNQQ